MKAKKIVSIFLVILLLSGSCITGLAATASGPSIYIELSNSTANVGDIIKASVKIEGIRDFSGYQANLKYDPTVLVPCDPDTGEHYNNKTVPKGNTVLNNKDYTPLSMQSYDFDKGLLNFGCAYMMLPEYSLLGHNEASGTLAVIGFKVINKAESTKIAFKSSERMPGSIDGTILFDYSGKIIKNYKVIQPPSIKCFRAPVATPVLPTPTPVPPTPTSTHPVKPAGSINLEIDKRVAAVGDVIRTTIAIDDIPGFSGYQVNLRYNNKIFQPITQKGTPFTNQTKPEGNTLLLNEDYIPLSIASNDIDNGILCFGRAYMDNINYKSGGAEETSGVLATIMFKVIGSSDNIDDYYIGFADSDCMPGSVGGTMLLDWNNNVLKNYRVTQTVQVSNTPAVKPTLADKPTPTVWYTPTPSVMPSTADGYIKLDYSLNNINVGSTIDTTLSVKDIAWFSGYQVNLRYNPKILQPLKSDEGIFTSRYMPRVDNRLLQNRDYQPMEIASHDLDNGLLSFGVSYLNTIEYRECGPEERTGVLTNIKFKVIGASNDIKDYYICFEETETMPGSINGTYLFNANSCDPILDYSVVQPYNAHAVTPTVTPTSPVTPTAKVTPSVKLPVVAAVVDKNYIGQGDIVKYTLSVDGFEGFAGFCANIKYDPTVFQPVDLKTGKAYTGNTNDPTVYGNILNNYDYSPITVKSYDFDNGILNIGRSYMDLQSYKEYGPEEKSGIVLEIGFKALKTPSEATSILLQDSKKMPGSLSGTYIYDWNGNLVTACKVLQADPIKGYAVTPTFQVHKTPSVVGAVDKLAIAKGDIVKYSLTVNDFEGFAGYSANIKYDPEIFQPVDPNTGIAYSKTTIPTVGITDLLSNNDYSPLTVKTYDFNNGILNIGRSYMDLQSYKTYGPEERSGKVLEIGFKALKTPTAGTAIVLQNSDAMPGAVEGTLIFDWSGKQIKTYKVTQAGVIWGICIPTPTPTIPVPAGSISLITDKTSANVGEIVKAIVRVDNVEWLTGYQVNIKYDAKLLQPIDPNTGIPFTSSTKASGNEIFCNKDYSPVTEGKHDLENGILNFGCLYMDQNSYRQNGPEESSGVLAVIGFKVLNNSYRSTSIVFSDTETMPGALSGTALFTCGSTSPLDNYQVIEKSRFDIISLPTPTVPSSSKISLITDKTSVYVGDIIKAVVRVDDVKGFVGYQVNLKYNPELLQPVDPNTGEPFTRLTAISGYDILCNENYSPVSQKLYDFEKGILNFGRLYMDRAAYQPDGPEDDSGVLAVIGFKVLKYSNNTDSLITFEDTKSMPGAIFGTYLFDSSGVDKLKDYKVVLPGPITIINPTPTFIYGDVNGDGEVTSTDYAIVQRYILGMIDKNGFKNPYTKEVYEDGYLAGDVDGTHIKNPNAEIILTSTDLAYLKRKLLGIIDTFPAENMK